MNNTSANYNEEVQNELPEEEVVLGDEPVITAEPEEETLEQPQKAPKQKKPKKGKWGYRILSLLVLALVATAIVLPVSVFTGTLESKALYTVFLDLIKGGNSKWFDAIPLVAGNSGVALAYGLTTYVCLLFLVVSAVLALVNLFTGRYRALKLSAFFVTASLAFNALSVYVVSSFALKAAKLDYYLLGGFGGAFLLYFILCALKNKRAWYNLLNAVLSIAFAGATAYLLCANAGEVERLVDNLVYKLLILVPSAIAALALFIALIRLTVKKGRAFELIVFIFELLAGGVLVYLAIDLIAEANILVAIVAAGVALLQVVITAVLIGSAKKKARKAKKVAEAEETPVEEAVEESEEQEEIEEEVEAITYEGGPIPVDTTEVQEEIEEEPVAEAEVAEEPAPAPAPVVLPTTSVQTAEYDYYNSKSFDPFIATLEGEERNQFTELFILKVKGTFPELPEYVVGGDNRAFFHKFFIYLGQYRDRVPDGLMAKIYSFSTRI